ncbi:MAG TPA: antibiotic biosynthesis monooxygenase, partial [Chloroflexota bacterium]|nr:antibiotic biosynthesis monooxygenase [Chloroflexota bacterium]
VTQRKSSKEGLMYGTIVHFRLKRGMEERLLELTCDEMESEPIPGFVALYLNCLDRDPTAYAMTVIFENQDSYVAHANSPQSNARYQ